MGRERGSAESFACCAVRGEGAGGHNAATAKLLWPFVTLKSSCKSNHTVSEFTAGVFDVIFL